MASLGDIEQLTKNYADGRTQLSDRVRTLEDEINAIKRRHLPAIKKSVALTMEKKARLEAALEESKGLFVKPKTMIFHGIKIGFKKDKGKISWVDDDQVIKLIKKHFPDKQDLLIKTTEKPVKDALQQLTAAELKRLGIMVNETGDAVVIKGTDSEVDKLVDALLKDDSPEEEAA